MRPLPEHRPSWLSTILFAMVALLIAVVVGVGFATTWVTPVISSYPDETGALIWVKEYPSEDKLMSIALRFGVVGAGLAGWGWRAPRETRFHITYLSGLGVMVLSYIHVRLLQSDVASIHSFAGENRVVLVDIMVPALGAILALVVGLVLYLAALLQDRHR